MIDRGADDRAAAIEAGALTAVERLLADGTSFSALSMQRIADEPAADQWYGAFRRPG